jgi:hypothetical protein
MTMQGYADDPRNTDNAWFETIATNYHDDDSLVFHQLAMYAQDPDLQFVWMTLTPELKVRPYQHELLAKVCC